MRANEVKDIITQAREQAMQASADREQCVVGIRTVCGEITEDVNSAGDYVLRVDWTTSDGVTIRTSDSGLYAGKSRRILEKIWKATGDELEDAMIEEAHEVYFYAQPFTNQYGEPSNMQKFRRVQALDRAHAKTEELQKAGKM